MADHTFSSCLKVSVKTNNGTSGAQKGKKDTEWWNIPIHEVENIVASDSQPLSDNTDDDTNGVENGGLNKQSKCETFKTGKIHLCSSGFLPRQDTRCDANSPKSVRHLDGQEGAELIVNSENMTEAGACQMSDTEHEMEAGINGTAREEMDAILPTEKRSTNKMERVLYLGTTEDTNLESSLYLVTASNMDKSSDSNNCGAKLGETEINECNISACEIEAEHPSGSDNKAVSAGNNSGSLSKILPSVLRGDHKNQTGGLFVQCQPAKVFLVDTSPNNLERTTEDRVDMMEIGLKVDTESRAKADIDIGTEDIMETEQPHCSFGEKQCEYKKVSDLCGGDTGPGESGKDGDESVMVAVDSEDESASTRKCMMGIVMFIVI